MVPAKRFTINGVSELASDTYLWASVQFRCCMCRLEGRVREIIIVASEAKKYVSTGKQGQEVRRKHVRSLGWGGREGRGIVNCEG